MDSDANSTTDPESTARRRSGRVQKIPQRFSSETTTQSTVGKRKRTEEDGGDDDDDDDDDDPDNSDDGIGMSGGDAGQDVVSEEEAETSDDDEQPSPPPSRRRKKTSQSSRGAKRPAAKRTRTTQARKVIASLPTRPKKVVRLNLDGLEEGLFADVFTSGDRAESVAQRWYERYQDNDAEAAAELINFILRCAGCHLQITVDDVNDPDHCDGRLTDLQNQYQEQTVTEYPLVSKAKSHRSFRSQLGEFLNQIIRIAHETELLYKESQLITNLHLWVATMSSSSFRPFRHTATLAGLTFASGLVDVAVVLDARVTNFEQQANGAKKGKNKARAAEIQRALVEANRNRDLCDGYVKDFFETIFVIRYKDVDPKIRTECVEALGYWILTLPTTFLAPMYLRYLGWMLSDPAPVVRQEVLKQLEKILKRDSQQLGHFIDKFRPRLVEMAAKDIEIAVRVAAVSLSEILRGTGLLEPTEIDAIGKLIFDGDSRVRKTVAPFFDACVKDVIDAKIEEMGGNDVLDEAFENAAEDDDDDDDDDYDAPRREWVAIKCLAETLAVYDAQLQEEQPDGGPHRGLEMAADMMLINVAETSMSLAAQALHERIREIQRWELIAGYLLYDHTTSTRSKNSATTAAMTATAAVRDALAPLPAEEAVLLEVLSSAVKLSLSSQATEVDKSKKRTLRTDATEAQEETAIELAEVIPKLLSKFGADPETAIVVLRMERLLKLDVFQQLRQDSSKNERLLEEIGTQFKRHDDKRVLAEAAACFLHARQHEELEELADSKLGLLWENTINTLRNFDKSYELPVRGNMDEPPLTELSNTLMKMSKLASISECFNVLEATTGREGGGPSLESELPVIKVLINIVQRGKLSEVDADIDDLEDEVTTFAIKSCQFYFMWKVRNLLGRIHDKAAVIPAHEVEQLDALRDSYCHHLIETFSSRQNYDELRLFATGTFCDLHVLFATIRTAVAGKVVGLDDDANQHHHHHHLGQLCKVIEPGLVRELVAVFDSAERTLAKKSRKVLNEPDEDEDPIDDEEEDEDDEELSSGERMAAELKAQRALCELAGKFVLAICARVLDQAGGASQRGKLKKRMLRNQARLGLDYKEVLSFLDETKPTKPAKKDKEKSKSAAAVHPAAKRTAAATALTQAKSAELVVSDDEDDDEDPFEVEEGSREDLRRRELLDDEIEDDEDEQQQEHEHEHEHVHEHEQEHEHADMEHGLEDDEEHYDDDEEEEQEEQEEQEGGVGVDADDDSVLGD